MRPDTKHILSFSLSLLMLICFVLSNIFAREIPGQGQTAFLRNQNGSWNLQDARRWESIQEDSDTPVRFTLWEQEQGQAKNPELSRSAQLTLLKLSGPSDLVLPWGQVLGEDDYTGCLISSDAALSLFGSDQVLGRTVQIGSRTVKIRGILRDSENLLAVQTPTGSQDFFHSLALYCGKKPWRNTVQDFTTVNGLMEVSAYSLGVFYSWAQAIIFLLPLLVLLGMLVPVLKILYRKRHYPLRFFPGILLFLLGVWGFLKLFPSPLHISEDMLPPQWSDLSFYAELFAQWRDTLHLFLTIEKYAPDLAVLQPFLSCLGWAAAAVLLYLLGMRRVIISSERILVAGILLTWLTLLAMLMLLPGTAPAILENHGLIFLLPCYFTFQFLMDKYGRRIP